MSSHFKVAGTFMLAVSVSGVSAKAAKPAKIDLAPRTTTTSQPAKNGGGASDLLNQTKIQAPGTSSGSLEITTGCTDSNGAELKEADPAFQRCLVDAQKPGANGAAAKRSVGLKIGK
jgi:hypothetical protein